MSPVGSLTHVHTHTLDDIVGYEVRQTLKDRQVLGRDGPVIARVDGASRYADALKIAYEHRNIPSSYALVDSVYACGCTDRDIVA